MNMGLGFGLSLRLECTVCGQWFSEARRKEEPVEAALFGVKNKYHFCCGCLQFVDKKTEDDPEYRKRWDSRMKEKEDSQVKDHYVEIVAVKDDEVVKRMGPMSEHKADKVEDGANINLDHERFFTRIVTKEA